MNAELQIPEATLTVDEKIDVVERGISGLPAAILGLVHHFSKGIYARELRMPAGTILTGKIHRTEHLNIMSAGVIRVWSEAEGWREIHAPFTFVAKPGTRRIGVVLQDTVWTTIHGTSETDLDKLETELIVEHHNPLLQTGGAKCLGPQ